MTLISDALIKVAQRLAESEKSTFELKQYIDAELEKQKKAFPWMFSSETIRISPPPTGVSVVSHEALNQQIRDCHSVPVYATSAYDSDKAYGGILVDDDVEPSVRDITDEEVRGYCYGNGYWINIQAPKTLKEKEDGTHIIEDEYGNVYTMKPTWNCISLMVKGDEE